MTTLNSIIRLESGKVSIYLVLEKEIILGAHKSLDETLAYTCSLYTQPEQ